MPTTLPISYDKQAPGTRAITYSVGGVAPDLSAYSGRLQVWQSGASTTATHLFQLGTPTQLTLGAGGSIVINMVAFESQVVTHAPTESVFHYTLDVQDGSNPRVFIASGPVARNKP
jgi:hypothetical protein